MNVWNKQKIFFDRTLKTWHGSNRIVLWSKFVGNTGKCNADRKAIIILMITWVKFCCLQFILLNAFEIENSMRLWWNVIKPLCGQYGSNQISWLEFARNTAKFNIDRTICNVDKDWSKSINGKYGSAHIVPNENFSKVLHVAKKSFRWKLM